MPTRKLLSEDQVAAYERDGFLSPVTVMSEAEADAYRARFESAEAKWSDQLQARNRMNAHLALPVLDELAHHPKILDAVEDLLGPDILLCGTVLFIKEAGDPGFVSWHQDARYVGLEPYEQATTAWLALSPSTSETGCMRMAPGTHKTPLRDHDDTFGDENILTRGQTIHGIDEAAAVELPLRPGQMSFHHLGVAHASAPNRGADRRIGFVLQHFVTPEVRSTLGPVLRAARPRRRSASAYDASSAHRRRDVAGRPRAARPGQCGMGRGPLRGRRAPSRSLDRFAIGRV